MDLKNQLYKAIDAIQDEKLLAALIIMLSAGGESGSAMELDAADALELKEREARCFAGRFQG